MPTVTITENTGGNFTGVDDAELDVGSPTTNFGSASPVVTSAFNDEHTLIRFGGLSNIPSTATVTAVTVRLNFATAPGSGDIVFRRCLRNWVEAQATWNEFSTGNSWSTGGCRGDGTDRVASASATITHGTSSGYVDLSAAGLVSDVQAWVDGTNPNHGWLLTDSAGYIEIISSEGANGSRPEIIVTYTESGGGGGVSLAWIRA